MSRQFEVPTEQKEVKKETIEVSPEDLAAINDPETTHVEMYSGGIDPALRVLRAWKPGESAYEEMLEKAKSDNPTEEQAYGKGIPRVYTKAEALERFNFEVKQG